MMDSYEPTRALFLRIQNIDPENASKIMGYILIQDQGEKEMLRIAFGPESLILAVINRAKSDLGILPNASSAPAASISSPSPFSSLSNAIPISRPNPLPLSITSPRLASNCFNPSSPSSPSVWPISGTKSHPMSPNANNSLSYAAVVNGTGGTTNGSYASSISSPQLAFNSNNRENFVDDYHLQDQNLSVLSDPLEVQSKNVDFFNQTLDLARSSSCRSDSVLYPYWDNTNSAENSIHFHRRSCSVNDVCFGTDDSTSGFGYKPCLYFARGFCKNGSSCKFVHGGGFADSGDNSAAIVGSPCKFDAFEQCQQDLMRSKVAQQQILAAQFMSGVNLPYNKLNFLQSEAQRSASAALMMGEDFHKLNRCRVGRSDFSGMGGGDNNPGSRQIYLTFPADSTFREEDVSNYFSMYGPVQDVRIPYQQKRMFGFVTFLYCETVKLILAKGNPHFVCESRVLVKPYKEKGKLPDKKQQQQQQLERGEFSSCSSPSGLDSREPFDLQIGGRMLYNTHEMMWRNKLELQADLQHAIDLQGRRLMNLKLMDLRNLHHQQHLHNMPVGSPLPPPNHSIPPPSNGLSQDLSEEHKGGTTEAPDGQLLELVCESAIDINGNVDCCSHRDDKSNHEERDLPESLEHILPDNLFYSPTKSAGEQLSIFSPVPSEVDGCNMATSSTNSNNDPLMPTTSALAMAPLKSCFLEMPRLSSGHGAIGM
ncbi:hypothetical protein Nepgr_013306 [Nepenthes gracilis]|uniref:Uncharacterized protein n=1 Tax=Nepenthes gracilis TaxID=150966 RepID=A0AAD3SH70_NEPGR|nr:hypothetical protein Nepgr_013306 [Nepenthes gracilis]